MIHHPLRSTVPARRLASPVALASLVIMLPFASPSAQQPGVRAQGQQGASRPRQVVKMDSARAAELYVSNRPSDHPQADFARQIAAKQRAESIYVARAPGAYEFRKITYKSSADGMEIPAYIFAPINKRGTHGHAAMVWVHGGVHGDWGTGMFPFVKEAVERGYVIITPDYRGSTGHGAALYNAIDYGGKELDDVESAVDVLKSLPYVDPDRIGIMGWSHGGFITAHLLMRGHNVPFKAGAAIVPVTNLVFRLSYKGPGYQRSYATQPTIGGLPFEKPDEYIKRSPLYHVDSLFTPILVHVATNDQDVNYVEDQQLVDALRSRKPELSETKIYVNPAPWGRSVGHAFSRRVDPKTLERVDSPAQIDSWNRTWAFLEWYLRPYEDHSKPIPAPRVMP
ncbi:MAG TPA: alpha/beta fold hydrolase [Gemmatimonadaceae bacterium]|nr:alpha/beta fold hydrolase [Gemmatimonadaceae bacterium]